MWYRLAVKLGWPVQVLQRLTTSKEFVRWKVYLEREPNEFDPLFWYLAQIAFKVVQVNCERPDEIQLKDFLLKFEREVEKVQVRKKRKSKKQRLRELQLSKQVMFAAVGLSVPANGNGNGKEKKRKRLGFIRSERRTMRE